MVTAGFLVDFGLPIRPLEPWRGPREGHPPSHTSTRPAPVVSSQEEVADVTLGDRGTPGSHHPHAAQALPLWIVQYPRLAAC
ncbi:hypothetical protein NDU88_003868 [Pleurodeles waltl]|uniref:Uncharacterized protein n=1 Tax=Pleurodeles waltl TaxID=8319 RepID=A0AAV7W4Q0_PLEWA|nr:hypothetical protein NDU88_003868 [Pleurodeles waltl]